jgi:uncharacterized protein (DUF885 family)
MPRGVARLIAGLTVVLPLICAGCHRALRPAPSASDETESKSLARLADDYWRFVLEENPLLSTYLGDRARDEEMPDLSADAHDRAVERLKDLASEVDEIDGNKLAEPDRVTRDVLSNVLRSALDTEVCHLPWWNVNPLDGVQETLAELPQTHGISRPEHARALGVRYLKASVMLDQQIDNLRHGLKKGFSSPKIAVDHVIAQLKAMLAQPPEASTFISLAQLPEDWRDDDKVEVRKHLAEAVRSGLYPALQRYLSFLETEYLPAARSEVGVSANKNGGDCYIARIKALTGYDLSPEEIHKIGLAELEKNEAQMKEISLRLSGSDDLRALKEKLRADRKEHVSSPRELLEYDRLIVQRAEAVLPKIVGRMPSRRVELRPLEAFRERDAPAAYYEEGAWDGARPGYYYVNTYDTPHRLLFQREALAFHEAVPGHHVQLTLAQELKGLPAFRRAVGQTAFVEGWAHYAELLADELGLYSGDEARFGMLSDQALRAARLVVDTGLHTQGWSREQAIQYLVDHTAEPPDECEREVDRYIVWPAQALAYKLGQLEFLRLRAEAKDALGDRFDLRAFHDAVLSNGAIPLPVLRRVMTQWTEARLAVAKKGKPVAK